MTTDTQHVVLNTARQTIQIEAAALLELVQSLDRTPDFEAVVNGIVASSGRVVVTGMGKSAIIAQKIVATLNSTGQPALFLHAADAIHGDLGMVQAADWVICISKSGETPEIKVLAPLLKNFGVRLVAMTANAESFLAKQSDFVLHTPITQEADPNNLAPTASTAAQMALGDALATSLLALRGFSAEDFAKFHPGGSLGKQLYLRVADLYPLHERPFVKPNTTLPEILLEISSKRLGAVAVLNEQEQLLGIITDGDLRRMLSRTGMRLGKVVATNILTATPTTIHPQALAVDALNLMRERSISQLIVLRDNEYLGMIHLHDLVREGII
jgi:arabinose-5-phosphate isomerase